MKISESITTLHNINKDLNKMPSRLFDSFHNNETKDDVAKVFTDMMQGENAFEANVKAIRTMSTVEDILLNELRK